MKKIRFAKPNAAFVLASAAVLASAPAAAKTQTCDLLVFSNAKAGQEAEYNRWYNTTHLIDVTAVPGVVSGRRYVLNEQQLRPPGVPAGMASPGRYLALYTITTSDLAGVFAEMTRRIRDGRSKMSDTLDVTTLQAYTYCAIRKPIVDTKERQVEPSHVHLVFTDATPGQDAEYNDWYDKQHAPDIVSVPGVLRGQRFKSSPVQMVKAGPTQYLVRFDMVTTDFTKFAQQFGALASKMPMSKSFGGAEGFNYRAVGALVNHGQAVRMVSKR